MKLVFDSSSIFEAVVRGKVKALVGNYTLDLARYELGNILWKRRMLTKDLNGDDYKRLIRIVKRTLDIMELIDVRCHEDEAAELAGKFNLTFYDASYVFLAKFKEIPLVTEDRTIRSKIGNYLKILTVEEL